MGTQLEQVLISFYKPEMLSFMLDHPEAFDEAIELALTDIQPFSWRAAWLLVDTMKENDPRIKKHIKKIFEVIENKKDGHQRELLKILMRMKLSDRYEGEMFNLCMNFWESPGKSPSIRHTAFRFIMQMAEKHNDLKQEITFLTQDHYLETLSPGAKRSIEKMINEMDRKGKSGFELSDVIRWQFNGNTL